MTQSRIVDYGTPIIARTIKNMIMNFAKSAVLNGFDFAVDSATRLRVNPGTAVTDQGVMIIEDEAKFLTINNSSTPADYTVYYSHSDLDITGGVPADLTLETGLLTDEVVTGTILGYVRYPGGGVPLSTSHFLKKENLKMGVSQPTNLSADWIIPIKGTGYIITNTTGTINVTDVWDVLTTKTYMKIANNGLSTGSISLVFPFKVKDLPYSKLQLLASLDVNTLTTPLFIDSVGSVISLSDPMLGNPSYVLYDLPISKVAIQSGNSLIHVMLQFQLAASKEARIQAIGLSDYALPF